MINHFACLGTWISSRRHTTRTSYKRVIALSVLRLGILCVWAFGGLGQVPPAFEPQRTDQARPKVAWRASHGTGEAGSTDGLRTMVWGGREITYEVIDGWAVYDGDILLGQADEIESRPAVFPRDGLTEPLGRRDAIFFRRYPEHWPGAVIPYEFDGDPTEAERQEVLAAMAEFNLRTAVTFVPRSSEDRYVRIERSPGGSCFVGGDGNITRVVTIGCGPNATVHELGHSIGLIHEHQRPDREEWAMFPASYSGFFGASGIFPRSTLDQYLEESYPFDYRSVMHYGFADSIPPGFTGESIGGQTVGTVGGYLSPGDVAGINRLYGEPSQSTVITTNPEGLEIVVDGHRVTTPAVFHWVSGSKHVLEAPLWQEHIVHRGEYTTFHLRYLYGRWNDGGSRIHEFTARPETTWIEVNFIEQSKDRDDSRAPYKGPRPYGLGPTTDARRVAGDLFEGLEAAPRGLTFVSDLESQPLGPQVIRLTNRGDSAERYTIAADRPWLTAEPAEVSLQPGASADIEVRVSRGSLQPEMHKGNLRVRPASLRASAAPLRPISVAFVVLPELVPVRLGKRGGTLDVAVSATEGFLGRDGRPVGRDGRVISANGNTYFLAKVLGGIAATFEPQSQTLDLPGGSQVTLVQRGEGEWYIEDEPVQTGHRFASGGQEYVLELTGGRWRPAPYAVRVAAGKDSYSAFELSLRQPSGVAVDASGNVFVTDLDGLLKVDETGDTTRLFGPSAFGSLAVAIAVHPAGDLYIADEIRHQVFKIDTEGRLATVAGIGEPGYAGDGGPASKAQLSHPWDVAVDAAGNVYIADSGNRRVRKIDGFGTITTVAGTGELGDTGDGGPATQAQLHPNSVAVDVSGNVYVGDSPHSRVRKIDLEGTITTVSTLWGGSSANDVAVDAAGTLYVADGNRRRVHKIDRRCKCLLESESDDLSIPSGVAVDATGNVYVADLGKHQVLKIDPEETVTTLVGGAPTYFPSSLAVDALGTAYMTERDTVLRVEPDGSVTTVAGVGWWGFSGDGGPATEANLDNPAGIALDAVGNVYVADVSNSRVRKIDPQGTITTFAGNGASRPGHRAEVGDLATDFSLMFNRSIDWGLVSVDAAGSVYIETGSLGSGNVAVVDAAGYVTSVFGDPDQDTYWGFHPARQPIYRGIGIPLSLKGPDDLTDAYRIAVDDAGSLYFVERVWNSAHNLVHKLDRSGAATTLAKIPGWVDSIAAGGDGQLYIASSLGNAYYQRVRDRSRIWRIDTRSGMVEVIAGNGEPWFRADRHVSAMAVDPHGSLWFASDGNITVLERLPLPPQVTVELPGGGTVHLSKRAGERVWRMGDTPVQEGYRHIFGGTEYVLGQVGGQWKAVSVRAPLGASGESAEIEVLADGSLFHEPTGRLVGDGTVITASDFDDYRLVLGPEGVRTLPALQTQRVDLPGGGEVHITKGTDGIWRHAGSPVKSGGNLAASGRHYQVVRGEQGRWRVVASFGGYSLQTVVGRTPIAVEGVSATDAVLFRPTGIAADAVGNVFIADAGDRRIRRVDGAGRIWSVAGTGVSGSAGDGGPAVRAQLESPGDLALDGAGNVFLLDGYQTTHHRLVYKGPNVLRRVVRRIDATSRTIETLGVTHASSVAADSVGNLFLASWGDRFLRVDAGQRELEFNKAGSVLTHVRSPSGVAVNARGTDLYSTATDHSNVRRHVVRIDMATREVETVTNAIDAHSVALDAAGRIYVGGRRDGRTGVFRVDAGTGNIEKESFFPPPGDVERVAADRIGNVFITQPHEHRVSRIDAATWEVTPFAGGGDVTAGWRGGAATNARLDSPTAVAVDTSGTLFYADANRVWKLDPSGIVTKLAGTGDAGYSGDGGPAIEAKLNRPGGLAVDLVGNVYVADTGNHRVRRINTAGMITTVAGTGELGDGRNNGDDGPATRARTGEPSALAVDSQGNLYLADAYVFSATWPTLVPRVRKVNTSGTITSLADGSPFQWAIYEKVDLAMDRAGNLFVAEIGGADEANSGYRPPKVFKINTTTGSVDEFYESDAFVTSIAIDRSGSLHIAGFGQSAERWQANFFEQGSTIRTVAADGTVSVIAGNGKSGFSGDSVFAAETSLSVSDMVVDRNGKIWFADPWARRIRVLER